MRGEVSLPFGVLGIPWGYIGRSEVPTQSDRPSQSHHTVGEFPPHCDGCVRHTVREFPHSVMEFPHTVRENPHSVRQNRPQERDPPTLWARSCPHCGAAASLQRPTTPCMASTRSHQSLHKEAMCATVCLEENVTKTIQAAASPSSAITDSALEVKQILGPLPDAGRSR